jgi:hypothetical protein
MEKLRDKALVVGGILGFDLICLVVFIALGWI